MYQSIYQLPILISLYILRSNTRVVVVPSQKDICHPWMVYPQPPFSITDDNVRMSFQRNIVTSKKYYAMF